MLCSRIGELVVKNVRRVPEVEIAGGWFRPMRVLQRILDHLQLINISPTVIFSSSPCIASPQVFWVQCFLVSDQGSDGPQLWAWRIDRSTAQQ